MYVPQPLLLRPAGDGTDLQAVSTGTVRDGLEQRPLDERDPLTLRTAHRVGAILRHVPPDAQIATRYAYYMLAIEPRCPDLSAAAMPDSSSMPAS